MKRLPLFLYLLFFSCILKADEQVVNPYQLYFNEAYQTNPSIPKGMLEAVSFNQTRFYNLTDSEEGSCIDIPKMYTVMGLTLDGKKYFRNNLTKVALLSGYSEQQILTDVRTSILAYAKAYTVLQQKLALNTDPENHVPILIELSELPIDADITNNFALNSQLYVIYKFLTNGIYQSIYGFPDHHIDLQKIFGANLSVLSAKSVTIDGYEIMDETNGASYKYSNTPTLQSTDYAPALWDPAASCNYGSRSGAAITDVTIHFMQGTYAGSISWFKNCASNVSAHYNIRASDGQITQMVRESDKGFHLKSNNSYTIGIEHEGWISQTSWFTSAMYSASSALVRDICNSGYGINPLRTYHGPACSGSTSQCLISTTCYRIKGHQHFPGQTHNDPGPNWNWYKFYTMINNNPTITTVTATTGTLYDNGGASGNYTNDLRQVILIQPSGAQTVSINFTQFSTETNFDWLYIYDGSTTSAPLIGRYSGTTNPGAITSSGGSLLLDFRTDCATISSGWALTYNGSGSSSSTTDIVAPTTQIQANLNWQTQDFVATVTDSDNVGGSGVDRGYYQVIDFDGTEWRANNTRGYFSDNFDQAIHADWTAKTGTWNITSQALYQSDDTQNNTNIYAPLTQTLSNRYLYHFVGKITGAGNNRRAGFHFMCDNPDSLQRGNSYFVWFRLDDQKLQIYKTINNSFASPMLDVPLTFSVNVYYDYKVLYDRITGLIRVYQNNILVGTVTDSSPIASGTHISFRSGNSQFYVNELKIYRSRGASVNITVGTSSSDIRYQNIDPFTEAARLKTICTDSAGNLSAVDYYYINADWTAPGAIKNMYDGSMLLVDSAINFSATSISANWTSSSDPHSGIEEYYFAIGSSAGDSDLVGWTNNFDSTTITINPIALQNGTTYYISAKAKNGAGLWSPVITSNGQVVDTNFHKIIALPNDEDYILYANPISRNTLVYLSLSQEAKLDVKLVDVLGRETLILGGTYGTGKHRIPLSLEKEAILEGVYFVHIYKNGASKPEIRKVVYINK
ncbi:MAG: N-acetylmuramoyl-L-alanine amidase [Bacteroidetes bacterium]|nr:N-acetylmuramoyl-L-alanine amidase [Bacteroidota bacterium]